MRVLWTLEDIEAAIGDDLGPTDWITIDQRRIDAFAEATGDQQWIHVDPARAAEGPYGRTVAHGYLTLSLVPMFGAQLMSFAGASARLNYGANRVRFPSPVPEGSRLRARASIATVTKVPIGHQVAVVYTIEMDGGDKPACVAETIVVLVGGPR